MNSRHRKIFAAAEVAASVGLLIIAVITYRSLADIYSETDAQKLARTTGTYAEVVKVQRENYASIYGNIPVYHELLVDCADNAESLEKLAENLVEISKLPLFKGLRNSSERLYRLAPTIRQSLLQTADTLQNYNQEKHETVLQAFDETIEILNETSGKFTEQHERSARLPILFLCSGILVAIGFFCHGILALPRQT